MAKRFISGLLLSLTAVLLSVSAIWGQTHLEKARALDEYIKNQYRASQPHLAKRHETVSVDGTRKAIAAGFQKYNGDLAWGTAWEYAGYVIDSSRQFGIDDPSLIAAMIVKESRVRPRARSKYAHGLMQIYWRVHKKSIVRAFPWIKTLEDLLTPKNNIMVGTWIFSNYLKQAKGDVNKALHRYLGTSGNRYVSKIMSYRGVMRSGLLAN